MNISLPYRLYDYLIATNHPMWKKLMIWGNAHRSKSFAVTFAPYASYQLRQEAYRLLEELKELYEKEVKCLRKR
jgi:hypothetical protein